MREKLSIDNIQKASQGLYFLLIIALLYSFFMITITNILLLVLGIVYLLFHHKNHEWRWLPVALLALGFLPYLQGLIISSETTRALKEIQHNLAYLSLPLAVILLPALTYEQRNRVFAFFISIMCISTLPVLYEYISHFEEFTLSLGKGKSIPTPIDHVRYSIFLSIACVFSFISYVRKSQYFRSNKPIYYLLFSVYLFIVLHVLAVRSGIILSYIGLFAAGLLLLIKARKFTWIAGLVLLIIVSPIVAYYSVPSFHKKIHYTLYDYNQQKAGEGANYSDSERMRSYRMGIDIWKDHKVLGIGTGDLTRELNVRYEKSYPDGGRSFLPHNQIIKFLATSGLLGLTFFLVSVYLPFFMYANVSRPYLIALIIMITVSFMVEATLERSYMLSLYLLIASLLYRTPSKSVDEPESDPRV